MSEPHTRRRGQPVFMPESVVFGALLRIAETGKGSADRLKGLVSSWGPIFIRMKLQRQLYGMIKRLVANPP